jgi:hypothetical protein
MGDQLKYLQSGCSDVKVVVDQVPQQGANVIGAAPSMLQSGPLSFPEYRHWIGRPDLAASWAGLVRAVGHVWILKGGREQQPYRLGDSRRAWSGASLACGVRV